MRTKKKKRDLKREVLTIPKMFRYIKTAVNIDSEQLKRFEVKEGVHQGSVLSPLLFGVVIDDEVTRMSEKEV